MRSVNCILICFISPGTKVSYNEPQDLTDKVREVLKDKKSLQTESEKVTVNETKSENKTTDTTSTSSNVNNSKNNEDDVKKRSKI
jgi:hypothetical protein